VVIAIRLIRDLRRSDPHRRSIKCVMLVSCVYEYQEINCMYQQPLDVSLSSAELRNGLALLGEVA